VVCGVINSVDTNGVDAQFLEYWNVTIAAICVCDRVGNLGGSTWLVVEATDVETVTVGEESYGEN
jgi:hypothetical protein